MKNYYEVLGVDEDATTEEIKEAYREKAFKTHPDRRNGSGDHEQFVEVRDAYEVLSDPQQRARHDRKLKQQRRDGPSRHLRHRAGPERIERYGAEWQRRKSRQRRRRKGRFGKSEVGTLAESMDVLRYGLMAVLFVPVVYFLFGAETVAITLILLISLVGALCLADLFDDVVLGGRIKDLFGR